jgi:hypothetical protein
MHSLIACGRVAVVLLALAVLVGTNGGCTSDPTTTEASADAQPRYQPIPQGTCERIRIEDVAAQFDLTVPSAWEQSENYRELNTHWRVGCRFAAEAGDDRFATPVSRFEPGGSILLKVFREPADAPNEYRLGGEGLEMRREPLGATLGAAEAWWDEGEYSESVRERTIDRDDQPDVLVSTITVSYIVYHENLYLEASLDAGSDPAAVGDATAVLHDMVRALLDEAVAHLTLSE